MKVKVFNFFVAENEDVITNALNNFLEGKKLVSITCTGGYNQLAYTVLYEDEPTCVECEDTDCNESECLDEYELGLIMDAKEKLCTFCGGSKCSDCMVMELGNRAMNAFLPKD